MCFSGAPLFDFVASYGRDTEAAFFKSWFRKVRFVPLAGDPRIHWMDIGQELIGTFRLLEAGARSGKQRSRFTHKFPGCRMQVHGPKWPTVCHDRLLRSICSGKPWLAKRWPLFSSGQGSIST